MTFNLDSYLDRIGLHAVDPTPDGLRALQCAQLRRIPFEGIDPFLGRTPDLSTQAIDDKILRGGRGGYCFELNALLGDALTALGFETTRLLARVRNGNSRGGARSHLLLQVDLDGAPWLADAGFGGPNPLGPLRRVPGLEQTLPNGHYRLDPDPETGETVLSKHTSEGWTPLYGFDDAFVGDPDIAGANYLCANWHAAPFPNILVLAGFDGNTRIGVRGRDLTLETPDQTTKPRIADISAFSDLVTNRLGIALSDGDLRAVWAKLSN